MSFSRISLTNIDNIVSFLNVNVVFEHCEFENNWFFGNDKNMKNSHLYQTSLERFEEIFQKFFPVKNSFLLSNNIIQNDLSNLTKTCHHGPLLHLTVTHLIHNTILYSTTSLQNPKHMWGYPINNCQNEWFLKWK